MAITIDQIKELRAASGAGILDCRKALEQTNGDFSQAMEILREKGLARAAKRADRAASEGVIELYSHGNGRVGVMVEVNSETDFVARSPAFRAFAHEVALQVAAATPRFIRPEEIPAEILEQEREAAHRLGREEGNPEGDLESSAEKRVEKFIKENCLLKQNYIRNENLTVQDLLNQTVAAMGENIIIRRFARWEVGESTSP